MVANVSRIALIPILGVQEPGPLMWSLYSENIHIIIVRPNYKVQVTSPKSQNIIPKLDCTGFENAKSFLLKVEVVSML